MVRLVRTQRASPYVQLDPELIEENDAEED